MENLIKECEETTSSYSATGDFLQYINYGYRAVLLKKNYLWLLPFYASVAIMKKCVE